MRFIMAAMWTTPLYSPWDSLTSEDMDAQEMVDKLVEYGVLTEGTQVLSFAIDGEGENAAGTLDLSQAVSEEGASDEMFLAELGNTFIENYQLATLKLLVNGGELLRRRDPAGR